MTIALPAAVVIMALTITPLWAQDARPAASVGPGDRVKVTTGDGTLGGIISSVRDGILTIQQSGGHAETGIPITAVKRLQRAAGHRSRARSAGFGALIGVVGGAAAGLVSASSCGPDDFLCSPGFNALGGAMLGAAAGAVVGAVISPPPRWIDADVGALTNVPSSPSPAAPAVVRRWAVSVGTGVAVGGGTSEALEAAMRQAGFDDTSPAFFGPASPHPKSGDDPGVARFSVSSGLGRSWDVGVAYDRIRIGHTYGFRAPLQFLFVNYETTSLAVVGSRTFGPARAGLGPAWFSARSSEDHSTERVRRSTIGFVAEAGLRLPARTRVYLDLDLQYRHVGWSEIGAFSYDLLPGRIPFAAVNVPFNHWYLGIGSGVRF